MWCWGQKAIEMLLKQQYKGLRLLSSPLTVCDTCSVSCAAGTGNGEPVLFWVNNGAVSLTGSVSKMSVVDW